MTTGLGQPPALARTFRLIDGLTEQLPRRVDLTELQTRLRQHAPVVRQHGARTGRAPRGDALLEIPPRGRVVTLRERDGPPQHAPRGEKLLEAVGLGQSPEGVPGVGLLTFGLGPGRRLHTVVAQDLVGGRQQARAGAFVTAGLVKGVPPEVEAQGGAGIEAERQAAQDAVEVHEVHGRRG